MIKELIIVFLLFGFGYIVFETIFNLLEEFFKSKLPLKDRLKKLIRLRPDICPSLWMIFPAGLSCILIHLWLKIPINFTLAFPLIITCILGGLTITGFEYLFGYFLNIKLGMNLWRYTSEIKLFGKTIRLNYQNQICVYRSLAWSALTLLIVIIDKGLF